ncbi:MAG: hypothetical protein OEM62_03315 [Acidobacteriota bacterium]|nr:hypothetical protein [Acidobacteriota bacterium]
MDRPPRATVVAVVLSASMLACTATKEAPSYLASLDYQGRETLRQSLFKEDLSLLSNEDIERILTSKIELPHGARMSVLQLGGDSHVLVLPEPDSESSNLLRSLRDQLAGSQRLTSVAFLPSLLVPRTLSVAKLREAAARFQSDLLFVYRTPCLQFERNRFLGADQAKAYCVAEGVLLDVRTGIIPFSSTASSTFGASRSAEDLNAYETMRRSQSEAMVEALSGLAGKLVEFLGSAP